ncbi:carboxypeptidase-like regulatory domain-containing protein [Capnocytophaga sp. oral taxon 864]|uniref:carboxypeptidase-like regulatory domain-containing protein n=1 Tax=Capnocytophaga sp. oral taxon 864 TaxID=1316593 RepID=UPI000D03373A|nr:carboxypeptidase-like regulatory domain-containing protein [Capnocytophaga sp. oral taxon 864]AVM55915.1 hypothetical protein C3V44_10035 [Capnocytophaga sp. oral taxon 864]
MKTLFLILLFTATTLPAQVAELILLDATTKQTIANAEVYYTNTLNGTITNEEGKAKITVENDTLTLSHIGYATKKIFTDKTFTKATVYLNPQEIQLDEVVLYNFDLKKKIKYVINNYFKLYDTKTKILETTYREKTLKDGHIIRLYQIQLDWWTKNYIFHFKEPLSKFLQIQLKNTDYAKIMSSEEDVSNELTLEQKTLIMYLHLNPYLVFLYNAKSINIKKVEKNKENTIVTFDADFTKLDLILINSVIYFDNSTNAIRKIIFSQKPSTNSGLSRKSKIPYTSTTEQATWEITFTPYKNKLLLSSFSVGAKATVEILSKVYTYQIEQSFLRTGVTKGQIKKNDRIDVGKPFFEYVTPHKQGEAKFLLTKEEQDFINQ